MTAAGDIDPAASLAALERSKSATEADHFLDFGPWWYAPGAGTVAVLLALAIGGFDELNGGLLLFAILLNNALIFHDNRRRKIRPRPNGGWKRYRVSVTVTALCFGAVALIWVGLITQSSALGVELLPVGALVGWLLSMLIFSLGRSAMHRQRDRIRAA